ncbi:MAG TPA: vitamin B12-dependent ribonucleotide reductase, partial [Planctomycetaceae bacterium]|nr:vitamin B12-dependent ribonucleotide reductase [Planctomycetaceae bacterium]
MMHEAKGIVQDRLSRGLVGNNSGSSSGPHLGRQRERTDSGTAMNVAAQFCPVDQDPFDTVSWEKRTAQIKDESGDVLFEQTDCEIPESWSALATNVVVSKYFYGEPHTSERERSVRQLVHRVARTIADWGIADGYFATREDGENFYRDLA